MKTVSVQKLTILALLLAAGILLSLLESFIPVVMIVPGYKIGFANLTGMYALYAFGIPAMITVNLLRITIASLCTGTFLSVSFFISLTGTLFAMAGSILALKSRLFSIYGVSMAGAACHTLGQVLFVCFLYQSYVFEFFMPFLIAMAIISGLGIAFFTEILLKRITPNMKKRRT